MPRTLTIELTPEMEAGLARAKRLQGVASDADAIGALLAREETPEERRERRLTALRAIRGSVPNPGGAPYDPDTEDALYEGMDA